MLETTKEERTRWLADCERTQQYVHCREVAALCRDVNTLEEALPEIDLLARAAEALAYRGIDPISDIEKLRVAAGKIRAVLDPKDREEVADGE